MKLDVPKWVHDLGGHINMREAAPYAAVGVPFVNEVTNNGIITAADLESSVWFGMTYGAWFKLALGFALFLLILQRIISLWKDIRTKGESDKDK